MHAAVVAHKAQPDHTAKPGRRRDSRRLTAGAVANAAETEPSAPPGLRKDIAELCNGLPIADVLPDVLRSLSGAPSLVLQADAGAGKTTVVPLALLLDEPSWLPSTGKILVCAPRWVAWLLPPSHRGPQQRAELTILTRVTDTVASAGHYHA